ncbi:MAG: hypothetical protein ACTSWC_01335 [Promethearchaeota archaeon]
MSDQIKINNSSIKIPDIINYIKISPENIKNNNLKIEPDVLIRWQEEIPIIFNDPTHLLTLSESIFPTTTKNSKNGKIPLTLGWKLAINELHSLNLQINRIHALDKLRLMIDEKKRSEEKLSALISTREQLIKDFQISELQTKKKFVQERMNERAAIRSDLNIAKEEFRAIEIQYQHYIKKHEQLQTLLAQLNRQQREIYQQTNQITKNMDELDPRIIVYQEKLDEINELENTSDFNRIKSKLSIIEKEYERLQQERKNLIQKSQILKKRILQERKALKSINRKIQQLKPLFDERYNDVELLKKRMASIEKQIHKFSGEINQTLKNEKENLQNDETTSNFQPSYSSYSSLGAIESEIKNLSNKIDKYNKILERNLKSSDLLDVEKKWLQKKEEFKEKMLLWEKESKAKLIYPQIFEISKKQMEILMKFKNWVNILLASQKNTCNIDFSLSPKNSALQMSLIIQDYKGETIKFDDELARFQKSILSFSLIFAFYLSNNCFLVPIRLSYLDPAIITKQTFKKTMKYFSEVFAEITTFQPIKIVFFNDTSTNYEIQSQINVNT